MDSDSGDDSHTRRLAIAAATGVLDSDNEDATLTAAAANIANIVDVDAPQQQQLTPEERAAKLREAVEFYFGDENFPRDRFLRSIAREHPERFIPLATLAKFKRIASLSPDAGAVAAVIATSDIAELSGDGLAVRRRHPLPPDAIDAPYRTVRVEPLPATTTVAWLHALGSAVGRLSAARLFDPVAAAAFAATLVGGGVPPGSVAALSSSCESLSAEKPQSLVGFLEFEEIEATMRACTALATLPATRELGHRLFVVTVKQKKRNARARAAGSGRSDSQQSLASASSSAANSPWGSRTSLEQMDAGDARGGHGGSGAKPPLRRAKSWLDPNTPLPGSFGHAGSSKSSSWGHASTSAASTSTAAGSPLWRFTDSTDASADRSARPKNTLFPGKPDLIRSASAGAGLGVMSGAGLVRGTHGAIGPGRPPPGLPPPSAASMSVNSLASRPASGGAAAAAVGTATMGSDASQPAASVLPHVLRTPRGPDGSAGFGGLGRGRPVAFLPAPTAAAPRASLTENVVVVHSYI